MRADTALLALGAAYNQAREHPITGDLSLDVFLRDLPVARRQLVFDLSIPHWFDAEIAKSIYTGDESDLVGARERALALPFVQIHPRGLCYHDSVRAALRDYILRTDPERVREVCRVRAALLGVADLKRLENRELLWQQMYCMLAFDEARALSMLVDAFDDARLGRHLAVCHQLVMLAHEQNGILSQAGRATLSYLRAVLLFEQRDFPGSDELLATIDLDQVPVELRGRVLLRRGLILEESRPA